MTEKLTAPPVALIAAHVTQTADWDHVHHLNQSIRINNWDHQTVLADTLHSQLFPSLKHCVDLAREPGSSSWLASSKTSLSSEQWRFLRYFVLALWHNTT